MKRYIVTVREVVLASYEVIAETADEAADAWKDGEHLGDDERISGEAVGTREVGGA